MKKLRPRHQLSGPFFVESAFGLLPLLAVWALVRFCDDETEASDKAAHLINSPIATVPLYNETVAIAKTAHTYLRFSNENLFTALRWPRFGHRRT